MDPYLGEIRLFSWNWAPTGWHACDGTVLQIQQYAALSSLLGTRFGGDGVKTFGLPDLRGRVAVGVNYQSANGPITTPGVTGGSETVALTMAQIPAHNHSICVTSAAGTARSPRGSVFANPAGTTLQYATLPDPPTVSFPADIMGSVPTPAVAAGHENRQPYLVLSYYIALVGIYPPRN